MKTSLKEIDNYIFDLDGTILNSSVEVLKCLKLAYLEIKTSFEEEKITPDVIGPPLKGIFKLISPEVKDESVFDNLEKAYSKHYDYSKNDASTLYEGIQDLLLSLKRRKKRLFIATNKPKIATFRLLKMFSLDYFEDIYTIDKFEGIEISKNEMIKNILDKHKLDKEKTVMIGDSVHDSLAGKQNSLVTVGVLWGYGKDKTSLIKESDITVKSTKELLDLT